VNSRLGADSTGQQSSDSAGATGEPGWPTVWISPPQKGLFSDAGSGTFGRKDLLPKHNLPNHFPAPGIRAEAASVAIADAT
jgi:hypothetical protein